MLSRTSSFSALLSILVALQVYAAPNASDALNPAVLRNRILAKRKSRTAFQAASMKPAMAKVAKKSGATGSISGTVYQSDGATPASSIKLECFDSYGYPVENSSFNASGTSDGSYLIDSFIRANTLSG